MTSETSPQSLEWLQRTEEMRPGWRTTTDGGWLRRGAIVAVALATNLWPRENATRLWRGTTGRERAVSSSTGSSSRSMLNVFRRG